MTKLFFFFFFFLWWSGFELKPQTLYILCIVTTNLAKLTRYDKVALMIVVKRVNYTPLKDA